MAMINKVTILLIGLILICNMGYGQTNNYFLINMGTNVIDNSDGEAVPWDADRLDFKKPIFVEIEKRFNENFAMSFIGTSNSLRIQQPNNGTEDVTNRNNDFLALNLTGKYFIDRFIFNNNNIDLYVGAGGGYHTVAETSALAVNLNLGFNYWFNNNIGMTFQAIANKGLNNDVSLIDNYYQYNLGLAYKFKGKKENANKVNKTEEPKVEAEAPPVAVAVIEEQPAEAPVAANAPVDAPQAVAVNPQKALTDTLREAVEAIGPVYFDKNSSYFDGLERRKLVVLIELLNNNPTVTIRLDSYTDATGTREYNMFLSDRRLKRVRDYLINKGVNPSRLEGVSNGVDINSSCIFENRPCTEQEYAQQRRVAFTIND